MELTVREAAALTGRSPRTLRAQLKRGELRGQKRHGVWSVSREDLPLTERQRAVIQRRAEEIRHAVDEILPSRAALDRDRHRRSLCDLDAFRLGMGLVDRLDQWLPPSATESLRSEIQALLISALDQIAEAVLQFHREQKLIAIHRSRGCFARALVRLLLTAQRDPGSKANEAVALLEREILPALAGLARWADRLEGGRRRELA